SDLVHARGVEAGLDDRRDVGRELRRRPAFIGRELGMDEVEAVERVALVVDAAVHVHAALPARMALDHGRRVDDLELVRVRDDLELVSRHDRDHREQSALGLPALGTATDVIVRALGRDPDLDRTIAAMTSERPAREIGRSWPNTL